MKSIKSKRAFVTGAASGIGRCLCELLAREGAILYISDINEEQLKKFADELISNGADVTYFAYDVSDFEAVKSAAEETLSKGDLDILVNNAGIGYSNDLADTPIDVWKRLVDVNFFGPIYHINAFLESMRNAKRGQIVNVSSGQAFFKLPGWGAYASVKAALGVYSEILYYELKKYGITVTTIYPFMVNTPFYREIEGETWGAKLSMKLVPYYSMKPETVARIILKAIKQEKRVEKVSIFNKIGFYSQVVPFAQDIIATTSALLLTKRK
ncbi:MAG: SDR family oxidoreductase [Deltaproteobacteria bacterium]|nr:SDR family oxidoreductase [Deltaproteobacteria bacterium]